MTRSITAAIYRHWTDTLAVDVPVAIAGVPFPTDGRQEWFELWVDEWTGSPRPRDASPEFDVAVTLHLFVRRSNDRGRPHTLIDAARAVFDGAAIRYPSSGPIAGYVRFKEAVVRSLTQADDKSASQSIQHHLLTWIARATPA